MGFLPGFPTSIFLFLSALLIVLFAVRYFKKRKSTGGEKNNEHENISSDATEGETQRINQEVEEEYIPETLPIIISVNQKYKKHLEENAFLSRMKKDVFIRYGYRIPDI